MNRRDLTREERERLSYVREQLGKAESQLLDEARPVRERLSRAYRSGLWVQVDWIPAAYADAREEFKAIKAELTQSEALFDQGTVETTLFRMLDRDAEALAARILLFVNRPEFSRDW